MSNKIIKKLKNKKTLTGEPVTKVNTSPELSDVKEEYKNILKGVKVLNLDEKSLFDFADYVYTKLSEDKKIYQSLEEKADRAGISRNTIKSLFETYIDECQDGNKQQYAFDKINTYIARLKKDYTQNLIKALS